MQEKNSLQGTPVRYIKGVGPRKAHLFEKLGIENVSDLFYYLPRRYEDRSRIVEVKDLQPGRNQAVIGKVLKTSVFTARTGTRIFEIAVGGDSRRVFAVWYNQPFMKKVFSAGQTVVLYGKVELQKRLQISHPAFDILDGETGEESLDVGRIVPVYSLTRDLAQKYIRRVVHQAIRSFAGDVRDCLPTRIRARRKLVDSRFAIENIHFPYSFRNLERAYRRLVFEEFFILQAVMALRRKKTGKRGIRHKVGEELQAEFERLFTFKLTGEQKKCIKEIENDMAGEKPMSRLLQGDVGSGKTVVSMFALLLTARNGYQAAMMAPTEILARQHYVTISRTFMPLGLNIRLLVNGIDPKSRDKIQKELAEGEADIVIGTHSLFQEGINYNNLGLVVIDEQHKFGVMQRKTLRRKGRMPDTLVMTATPIPRSLVLTVFGDMDISLLKEKPTGREPVTTYWVGEDRRDAVYSFIRDEAGKGRQVFIVYPRVKETGSSDIKSAEEMYRHLQKDVFADLRLALIHGRMRSGEKKKVMDDFRRGNYDILIATTVIEVGVDIPNVTVMLVEHAERYGLAQLHQLRGRIGRGRHRSYCILLGEPKTDASHERLSTIAGTDDGFEIAEKDLDIRGSGEFLGTRQSGLPELRLGDIAKDFGIMEEAREEAFSLIKEDPGLNDPHNAGIRQNIVERFRGKLGI
ncbi:MAG: DNA helicase RecG [Candidatus Makaraimicrobium thalassicum]|nr:MAG: DNA helicase RecG [Candidatus Omnitrophota bacterium]